MTSQNQPGPPLRVRRRAGLIIRGKNIWLSELVAMSGVGLLFLALAWITASIAINYFTIAKNDREILALKKGRVESADSIKTLRAEARLVSLLRMLAAKRVNDHVLCQVAHTVSQNSSQFGYDPLLLLAVIRVESVFNVNARGRFISGAESGALGLMQLKFETAAQIAQQLDLPPLAPQDLLNPQTNLVIGIAYLTRLIARFRSFKLGLLAYNQGPGVIFQTLSAREPLSMEYYQKVLRNYYYLKKMSAAMD